MSVEVREVTSDEDLTEVRRIDLSAFGYPPEVVTSALEPWRRDTTNYLATDAGVPAGSCRVHDLVLTVPGGNTVPVSGVGDVGVLASHTRRGVLGSMMARALVDGAARGHVAAALYASEATIYGRFGFGPATRAKKVRIETARASLRPGLVPGSGGSPGSGRFEVVDPSQWRHRLVPAFEAARLRRPGEVARTQLLWDKTLGPVGEPDPAKRMCLAHLSADGRCDAYALYTVTPEWLPEGPRHSLEVLELVGRSDVAELCMWEAILSLDLVREVQAWIPADSVLFDALADRWAPVTMGEHDSLWVRLLDVGAALSARRYRVPGRLVLEVHGSPHDAKRSPADSSGVYELVVSPGGSAEVKDVGSSTGIRPDIGVGVAELGSLWLGSGSWAGLGAVGRVHESGAHSLELADAMFGWSPSPWVTQEF